MYYCQLALIQPRAEMFRNPIRVLLHELVDGIIQCSRKVANPANYNFCLLDLNSQRSSLLVFLLKAVWWDVILSGETRVARPALPKALQQKLVRHHFRLVHEKINSVRRL